MVSKEGVNHRFDTDGMLRHMENAEIRDNISAFANKYGFDVADVKKYADSMRKGSLGGASYAFSTMKRKIRIENSDKSLGGFVKIFSPIKAELYDRFGNVDVLREKYIRERIEERNVMEAARKRAEEEAEAERKRLEEFEVMSDGQLDKAYFKAIEKNDEARMRDLVNEAARRNGYVSLDEFKMAHHAPSYDEEGNDKSMVDVANNRGQIRESLNEQLRMNRTQSRDESAAAIREALTAIDRGENPTVTIYRAVPKSLKEGRVRNGDWVTLSKSYAEQHGNHALEGNYRIMEEVVPAGNLYWDGNDINEWGYDDRSDYRYKNTRNSRKLNDLITRDDDGNIIPLSRRFDPKKGDVRYRFIGEKGAANLDKAEEANTRLDNLAVAREMEEAGKDAKAIKMATGWERGSDKKWRYEVDDALNEVQLKTQEDLRNEYRQAERDDNIASRRWASFFDNHPALHYRTSKRNSPEENERLKEERAAAKKRERELFGESMRVRDIALKARERMEDGVIGVPLSGLLGEKHPLLTAYPEMKDIDVSFYPSGRYIGSDGYKGYYRPDTRSIFIDTDATPERMRSTLAHEIQHAIQHIEGFSTGGNYKTGEEMAKRMDKLTDDQREFVDSIRTYNEWKDKGNLRDDYRVSEYVRGLHDIFSEDFFRDISIMTDEEIQREYNRLSGQNPYERMTAYEAYKNIAGEVESRNVQSRMDMTQEERRASLASETEDVAREDQIFLNDALRIPAASVENNNSVHAQILDLGDKLHTTIHIVEAKDVHHHDPDMENRMRKAQGWYSTKTGEVVVVIDNHTSMEDVKKTVLHEIVGHKGLRGIMGEKAFKTMCESVYRSMPSALGQSYLRQYGTPAIAGEEYLAYVAEHGTSESMMSRITSAIKVALNSIGIHVNYSDKEMQALLKQSQRHLERSPRQRQIAPLPLKKRSATKSRKRGRGL